MTYTTEERKLYNEKYYAENKHRIAGMLSSKVECPLCHKMHSKANINRHINCNMCKKRQTKNQENEIRTNEINELKKQLEEIRTRLDNK
jgi:hypothetical protein